MNVYITSYFLFSFNFHKHVDFGLLCLVYLLGEF